MFRRIAILVLGTFAAGVLFYLPMGFLLKDVAIGVPLFAAAACLGPGILILVVSARLNRMAPEVRVVGVLASTVFRMIAVLGAGYLMYAGLPVIGEFAAAFVGWVVLFYIVTLFIETVLLYIDTTGSAMAESQNR